MPVEISLHDSKYLPQLCDRDYYNTGKMKKVSLRRVN